MVICGYSFIVSNNIIKIFSRTVIFVTFLTFIDDYTVS